MYDLESLVREPLLLDPLAEAVEGRSEPAFLRSAKIKITARCNLRCTMCRYGKGLDLPELPADRWAEVSRELAVLGARKVHFSGGEVLVRRDFEDVVHAAADAGLKVTFTSNLTLLTKGRAKGLSRAKLSSVSTSIDGATARTHDRIRGIPGAFDRTWRGISWLARERTRRGRRTRLRVNFVMMRANFREYPELLLRARDAGVTEVHPMPVDSQSDRVRLSRRLIRLYNESIAPRVLEIRKASGYATDDAFVFPFGRGGLEVLDSAQGRYAGSYYRDRLCHAPWLHLFIAWDGKVYLCCMTNGRIEPLGNVRGASVSEVFRGPGFRAIRDAMRSARLPSCHACDMFLRENRLLDEALRDRRARLEARKQGSIDLTAPATGP